MQIYGYHRTSTKEQHLDRGIQEIERYCNEHEMALTNIFTDQETGKNFNRPRYTVLVEDVLRLGTLVVFGFLKGFQPIAGFSYGAKKFDRLREAIKTSILWSTIFCVVVGLTIALFSTQIISQFTEGNTEMISVGQKSLMANGFSFFVFGFYTVYSSLFLALGKGTAGFVLGACRQGICFVPIILLLPSFWGINGILYAQPIADVISAIVTVFMALHLHKELATTKEH